MVFPHWKRADNALWCMYEKECAFACIWVGVVSTETNCVPLCGTEIANLSHSNTPNCHMTMGWCVTMWWKLPVSRSSRVLGPTVDRQPLASQQWDVKEAQRNCVLCVSWRRGTCLARKRVLQSGPRAVP